MRLKEQDLPRTALAAEYCSAIVHCHAIPRGNSTSLGSNSLFACQTTCLRFALIQRVALPFLLVLCSDRARHFRRSKQHPEKANLARDDGLLMIYLYDLSLFISDGSTNVPPTYLLGFCQRWKSSHLSSFVRFCGAAVLVAPMMSIAYS